MGVRTVDSGHDIPRTRARPTAPSTRGMAEWRKEEPGWLSYAIDTSLGKG